jgi:2-hydroxy-4-carboxymuconate semialdehyde hemiacetal dehydrogenase
MKVCLAGQGAFGIKYLEAMTRIPGIEVTTLAGGSVESMREVAEQFKVPPCPLTSASALRRLASSDNEVYLRAKRESMGHLLD